METRKFLYLFDQIMKKIYHLKLMKLIFKTLNPLVELKSMGDL